jgi:hypothetical protein
MYSAVSDFHGNRFLVLHGHNGITFIGKFFYISRRNFHYKFRESKKFLNSISDIVDTTGQNLIPITFIENTLVSEGTFKVRKRLLFRKVQRSHTIGGCGSPILIPGGYSHFGHFVPQLLPFLIRSSSKRFAIDLSVPDDVNRNIEILQYFNLDPKVATTQYRRLRVTRIASQIDLYPADTESTFMSDIYIKKFSERGFCFADKKHRLYLTRRDAPLGRKVINEDELLEQIATLGFLVIDPSTLSFAQASELFADSEIIVGSLGSAFFNMFGMTKGSIVIDFQGDNFIRWHLRKMCTALGLKNIMIINACDKNLDLMVDIPTAVRVILNAVNSLEQEKR